MGAGQEKVIKEAIKEWNPKTAKKDEEPDTIRLMRILWLANFTSGLKMELKKTTPSPFIIVILYGVLILQIM